MKKNKTLLIFGIFFLIVSVVFTVLVKNIDVAQAGEAMTEIGFSGLNSRIFSILGYSEVLYKITNYLGYIPILFAGIYCIAGLYQFIQRKSLKKVDKGFFVLAGLFVVAFVAYIIFDKIAINYRPVLIDGELEPSFPSSHTMLILSICFGIILLNKAYYSNNKKLTILNVLLSFLAAFIVVGRFFSGVHWATDIIGGLLYALAFLMIYDFILLRFKENENEIKA